MIDIVPGREARPRVRQVSWISFLAGHEFLIPLLTFILFLALTLPGISWGAPAIWHPDEVALRAIKALHGDWSYYEANFNHPFLPQNAMYLVGRAVQALGGDDAALLVAMRLLSAVLLGLSLPLVYSTARRMGAGMTVSALAPLFLLVTSEMVHNAHFAHTDAFVTFFSALTVFFLVRYQVSDRRGWLYASFFAAGLALSSKYNSLLLLAAPLLVYILKHRSDLRRAPLPFFEPLFMGPVLWVLGFGLGSPKFLGWTSWFLKRAVPAFLYNGNYGNQPGSVRGIIGQYPLLVEGLGWALFILYSAAFLWTIYRLLRAWRAKTGGFESRAVVLLCIFLLDLPILFSYNLAVRFFLPILPLLAVLSTLFVGDLYEGARRSSRPAVARLVGAGLALVLLFSLARTLSLVLSFVHDSRYAAGAFLQSLPFGSSLEETFYPPTIPVGRFGREHNYPLYFLKNEGDVVPTGRKLDFNTGEAGLIERGTDYLLIDSFTAVKFNDPYTCSVMQTECDFFRELAAGGTAHYRLLADFRYSPPWFLPQVHADFVNPEIRLYERVP